jgi:TolB-like protein/class 3 adenylate cyclase/Tfp pilus assembly protein PilF
MPAIRRLAAILAADVAGYSRLIGADEEGTLNRLRSNRTDVIDPKISEHRGRIVKTTGDGFLVEFASVVDALRCATEIQTVMAEGNAGIAAEKRIEFRIGINVGDVVVEDGDIFGDGVNVAARLEALANPGGICVSARVQEDAAGKLDHAFEDMGEQSLKNITRSVRVYRISMVTGATSPPIAVTADVFGPANPPRVPRLSIVVLPFTNVSNDPEQEYFADGITDDLTTDLSRISDSFVISRNTAFTYKGKPVDVKHIGRELGVRYVLEGSVRRTGDQIRVNAQLIDAESGSHLWADRFDTDRANLAEAQSDITGRLARVLNVELVRDAGRRIEQENPVDPDARDLVMRGWAWFYQPISKATLHKALQAFERALEIDPRSIDAKIGIAGVLVDNIDADWSSSIFQHVSVQQNAARAERLLLEALESDSNKSIAYSILGHLRRLQSRLLESRIALENAITLDPNNASANRQLGWTLLFLGGPRDATARGQKSLRLSPRDPYLPSIYLLLGWSHLVSNEVDGAIDFLIKGRTVNPRLWYFPYALAGALALKGDLAGAKVALAASLKLKPEVNSLAQWYAYLPWTSKANAPQFWVLQDQTLDEGLRRIGFPKE